MICVSMRIVTLSILTGILAMPSLGQDVTAPSTSRARLEHAATTSSFIREGVEPWHMRVGLTVYDEDGKHPMSGTLDEWWAGPGKDRTVIAVGEYKEITPLPEGAVKPALNRIQHLVNDLKSMLVTPMGEGLFDNDTFNPHPQSFGKTTLSCIDVKSSKFPLRGTKTYCFDEKTDDLRIVLSQVPVVSVGIRNDISRYQTRSVAKSLMLTLQGQPAIFGNLEQLETFDPTTFSQPLTQIPKAGASPLKISIEGGIIAGILKNQVPPVYPFWAQQAHIAGTVNLAAVISKEGKITSLVIMSSPDPVLSGAALDAVRQWRYQPYLLNGETIEVDTTINVNFNSNGNR